MRDRCKAVERIALLSLHSSPIAPLGRSDAGGMNLYVRRLADELARLGLLVDMFTRRTDIQVPSVVELGPRTRLIHLDAGLPQLQPKSRLPLLIPTMTRELNSFALRTGVTYDVLHCHYWISGLVGLACRDTLEAPVVSMFHTLSRVKEQYASGKAGADSDLRFEGERAVLADSDAVIGAIGIERAQLAHLYGHDPQRFAVIPPGVDTHLFRPHDSASSRRALEIDAERVVLFVGRLDPMKRLDILLRAVASLPLSQLQGLRLVIVGGNDEGDRIAVRKSCRLAHDLGLEQLVDVRSNVPQDQLPLYYSAATVCAVPSDYESFGMVAIESMACETPVVAFEVGGVATTVQHGISGFLARPGDVADFSLKLADALSSDTLRTMGRQGRASVRHYEWSSIAGRTLDIYGEVVAAYEYESQELVGAG
jgi:D-inositol-3-phosphate glycosyltransferase